MTVTAAEAAEEGVVFPCAGEWLVGVLHRPVAARPRGVLVVVGGPQTRVGSHRQFTLLARALAAQGFPVMRFDYRGMGDSGGALVGFEGIAEDLEAALAAFRERMPELREIVLWGLCDAASAALLHHRVHPQLAGLVLLNPWVTEGQTAAGVMLRRYYLRRVLSGELWARLLRGEVKVAASLRSLAGMVLRRPAAEPSGSVTRAEAIAPPPANVSSAPLAERMARGLERFDGPVLLVTSGQDLTAAEFLDRARDSRRWRRLLAQPRVHREHLEEADHTFSTAAWRERVEHLTASWLASW